MEKDLFPSRASDQPLADRMSRMEQPSDTNRPSGGCGCTTDTDDTCGTDVCHGHEGCGADSWGLTEYPLAMVYAPCQTFRALYDSPTALNRGTLFTELDLPLGGDGGFTAEGCACRMERRRV